MPGVTVEFLQCDARIDGRELSICRFTGTPDVHVEAGWLQMQTDRVTVNYEVVSSQGAIDSVALVTAQFSGDSEASKITLTVHLSSQAQDMVAGYSQGFDAGIANLAEVAERCMRWNA